MPPHRLNLHCLSLDDHIIKLLTIIATDFSHPPTIAPHGRLSHSPRMTLRMRLILIIPGALFLVALMAFEFGLRKGRDRAPRPLPNAEGTENTSDEDLVKLLLAQDLGNRKFAFPDIIEATTGHKIIAAESPNHRIIIESIEEAADASLPLFNGPESPIRGLRRINEASRYFEDSLRALIDANPDLTCSVPTIADGSEQRSGYPDLRIEHIPSKTVAYLDPKLFEESSHKSSLRTFYFEPKIKSSKVREDAAHFLIGFSHDGKDGEWTFTGWHLVDLSTLEVRLKAEFQASNRDLYLPVEP